jgi:hypothetical protein
MAGKCREPAPCFGMIIGCGRAIVRFALILFDAAPNSAVDTIGRVIVVFQTAAVTFDAAMCIRI